MGDAVIEGSNWRLVEVGRVVVISGNHPLAGRLATIVEIIDHKRVCFRFRLADSWIIILTLP